MKTKHSFSFWMAFFLCSAVWFWRLFKLVSIINAGILPDFVGYYQAAKNLISPAPDFNFIVSRSFGPPFVFLFFIPFVFLPLATAELAAVLINLVSYWLVFWLVWRLYFKSAGPAFWLLLALMSFAFPLVYSLGMGNLIGPVTLGLYSFWLFKNRWVKIVSFLTAVGLKLYPVLILPALWLKKTTKKDGWLVLAGLISAVSFSVAVLPPGIWFAWRQTAAVLKPTIDSAIYNQSFSSVLARLGLTAGFGSTAYLAFIFVLTCLLVSYCLSVSKKPSGQPLDNMVVLLCFALLIHPFLWQYYFASLLPWLMVKVAQKKPAFILAFLLLSFDGNRLGGGGIITSLLASSQFLAALGIFLALALSLEKRE